MKMRSANSAAVDDALLHVRNIELFLFVARLLLLVQGQLSRVVVLLAGTYCMWTVDVQTTTFSFYLVRLLKRDIYVRYDKLDAIVRTSSLRILGC